MYTRLKEYFRRSFKVFPAYRAWKRKILQPWGEKELEQVVRRIIVNVPYYHNYAELLACGFDLDRLPIIRKSDIMGHEKEMVSDLVCKKMLRRVETGGSTGCSLTLYRHWKDNLRETVYWNHAFSLLGEDLIIGVLRGNKPQEGLYEIVSKDRVVFSSYELGRESLDKYLALFNRFKISCLHAYPSSLVILARLIKKKYGTANLPYLKGILTSSEIFAKDDKRLVHEVFPDVTIVDFYGHSEMACCAYSMNDGYYHFYPSYGYVEFIDTGETIHGNRISEVVATSIMNTTFPFIRYATDDFVELDEHGNVVSIIGRTSDFLVNCHKELTPCIVSNRRESLQNVINFQYYQDTVGKMEFRVVVNDSFGEEDRKSLLEDLQNSFNGNMECEVTVVSTIERTKAGKQKRLIQKLNTRDFV